MIKTDTKRSTRHQFLDLATTPETTLTGESSFGPLGPKGTEVE